MHTLNAKNDITKEPAPLIKNKWLLYGTSLSKKDLHALLHPVSLRLEFVFSATVPFIRDALTAML